MSVASEAYVAEQIERAENAADARRLRELHRALLAGAVVDMGSLDDLRAWLDVKYVERIRERQARLKEAAS